MTKPFQQWTVAPHGKLVQVDENILSVVGEIRMPLTDLPRRMTVVRVVDDVQFVTAPGTRGRESTLVVLRPGGTTLVLNDVIGNIHDA